MSTLGQGGPAKPTVRARRRRVVGAVASLLGHLLILRVLLLSPTAPPVEAPAQPPPPPTLPPVMASLVEMPGPAGGAAAVAPAAPSPAEPEPPKPSPAKPLPRLNVRPPVTRPPPDVKPLPAAAVTAPEPIPEVTEAQLAGARTAGSGPPGEGGGGGAGSGAGSGDGAGAGGRNCDMVRRLQAALRKDPDIQAAVARAGRSPGWSGKPILVWNGDWIRSPEQEGKGLAGVRQAIIMEVGFAPEACRTDPMRGLVLISLSDRPGAGRLVLGSGAWRWSDLLLARGVRR